MGQQTTYPVPANSTHSPMADIRVLFIITPAISRKLKKVNKMKIMKLPLDYFV